MPLIRVIATILLLGASIAIEYYLAKRPAKWPGLLLPGIFMLVSLIAVASLALSYPGFSANSVLALVVTFVLANIPTMVLLGIFFYGRKKSGK